MTFRYTNSNEVVEEPWTVDHQSRITVSWHPFDFYVGNYYQTHNWNTYAHYKHEHRQAHIFKKSGKWNLYLYVVYDTSIDDGGHLVSSTNPACSFY